MKSTKKKKVVFEIRRSSDDQFFIRQVFKNGNILDHTETYKRKASAVKALNSSIEAIKTGDYSVHDMTVHKNG